MKKARPLHHTVHLDIEGIIHKVTCAADWYVDRNYGADADGNRGVKTYQLLGFEVIDIEPEFDLTDIQMEEIEDLLCEERLLA